MGANIKATYFCVCTNYLGQRLDGKLEEGDANGATLSIASEEWEIVVCYPISGGPGPRGLVERFYEVNKHIDQTFPKRKIS